MAMESRVERHRKGNGGATGGGKKRFWKSKKFKWILIVALVLIVAFMGVYAYYIGHFLTNIQKPKDSSQPPVQSADVWSGTDPVNIVLFGVDNRNNDPHPRSDSILIIHLDPVTKKAKVMSVMRDTWYKIDDQYGYEKINAAYALGGPEQAIKTLKDFLQIPINYYVKTDFQGFINIVDALGGVDIDVEKPLHYADDGVYDINLDAGMQHLDGQHALMYVRFRHDAMSDFARTERQRKFLSAVADKMATPATLLKLPSLLESVEPYIETNMSLSDMVKLGKLALDVKGSQIESLQVPPMDALKEGTAGGGQSVLLPDVKKTREEVYDFLGMDKSTLPADVPSQPQEYYNPNPVVPENPKVVPDTPEPPKPAPQPTPKPTTPSTGTGTGTTPGTTPPETGGTGTEGGTDGTDTGAGGGTTGGTGATGGGTGTGTTGGGTGTGTGTGTTGGGTGTGTGTGTTGGSTGTGTGTTGGTTGTGGGTTGGTGTGTTTGGTGTTQSTTGGSASTGTGTGSTGTTTGTPVAVH